MKDSDLLDAALSLPPRKREKFAEAVLSSIKSPSVRHIEKLWAEEAEARIDALLAGKVKTISAEKVLGGAQRVER